MKIIIALAFIGILSVSVNGATIMNGSFDDGTSWTGDFDITSPGGTPEYHGGSGGPIGQPPTPYQTTPGYLSNASPDGGDYATLTAPKAPSDTIPETPPTP